jgi:hypothetical protein
VGIRLAAIKGRLAEHTNDPGLPLEGSAIADEQPVGTCGNKDQTQKGSEEPEKTQSFHLFTFLNA